MDGASSGVTSGRAARGFCAATFADSVAMASAKAVALAVAAALSAAGVSSGTVRMVAIGEAQPPSASSPATMKAAAFIFQSSASVQPTYPACRRPVVDPPGYPDDRRDRRLQFSNPGYLAAM